MAILMLKSLSLQWYVGNAKTDCCMLQYSLTRNFPSLQANARAGEAYYVLNGELYMKKLEEDFNVSRTREKAELPTGDKITDTLV